MTARPLKFRVWSHLTKEFVTNWGKATASAPIAFLPEDMLEEDEGATVQFFDSYNGSPFRFQQFTGFKDVNGVDIYEGDLIEFHEYMGGEMMDCFHPRAAVIFKNGSFFTSLDEERSWFNPHQLLFFAGKPKIIGHINE